MFAPEILLMSDVVWVYFKTQLQQVNEHAYVCNKM